MTQLPGAASAASTPSIGDGTVWVVVVAGGSGSRFGGSKQYADVAGVSVLERSLHVAGEVADGVVAVVPESDVDRPLHADAVVSGGSTRAHSVRNGLDAVPADAAVVVVHDAARPAASPALFHRVVEAVRAGADGAVPGIPVTDSLRDPERGAVDRSRLVAVQTPQAFPAATLRKAHAAGGDASDDATLVEELGGTIVVVEGETTNLKLTHRHDLDLLERILGEASTSEARP